MGSGHPAGPGALPENLGRIRSRDNGDTWESVNGLGQGSAYLALFSEIGLVLLVTILLGVLGGYWIDKSLGTLPVFVLAGFFLGLTAGSIAVYRLITRFLARFE